MNLLGRYGAWLERRFEQTAELSWRGGAFRDFEEWRAGARGKLISLLGPIPARGAGQVEVLRSYRFGDLDIEELRWRVGYGPVTEAVLLKPSGRSGPLPGVLALHDHAGEKHFGWKKVARTSAAIHPLLQEHQDDYYGGAAWANELARRGYAVLVHDAFPFASRKILAADLPGPAVKRLIRAPLDAEELSPEDLMNGEALRDWDVPPEQGREDIRRYDAFAAAHEHVLAKSLFCAGLTFPAVVLGEDRAALQVLASRPEVDPRRLGCCGLSGGGLRSVYLCAVEERVFCSVAVGFMSTWKDFTLQKSFTHTWMLYLPHLSRYLDFPEVLGLHAPRPALVLAAKQDPLFSLKEVERAGLMLREIYEASGHPQCFALRLFPGPHCFNRSMQAEAFDWLDRFLSEGADQSPG